MTEVGKCHQAGCAPMCNLQPLPNVPRVVLWHHDGSEGELPTLTADSHKEGFESRDTHHLCLMPTYVQGGATHVVPGCQFHPTLICPHLCRDVLPGMFRKWDADGDHFLSLPDTQVRGKTWARAAGRAREVMKRHRLEAEHGGVGRGCRQGKGLL